MHFPSLTFLGVEASRVSQSGNAFGTTQILCEPIAAAQEHGQRFAQPAVGRPFRRQPPAVRRRDGGGGGECAPGGRAARPERRRAATSPGCRRAASTRVAPGRRTILPAAEVGWHALPDARTPSWRPPPIFRRRDRQRADGDARMAEGAASRLVGQRQLHRNADAQPARARRRCAGLQLPDAWVGWHNALRAARRRRPAPPPVAATAGARRGTRAARRAPHP